MKQNRPVLLALHESSHCVYRLRPGNEVIEPAPQCAEGGDFHGGVSYLLLYISMVVSSVILCNVLLVDL